MKSLSLLLTLLIFTCTITLNAQNAKGKSRGKAKDNGAMNAGASAMNMPYTAMYSSKFEIGDPKYAAIVLNAWKQYDDNKLDSTGGIISDTIRAVMPDGNVFNNKDSFLTALKTWRGSFPSAKSEVVAYISVRSIDKGDNIVFVWGTETDTKNDGTSQKTDLHEVWAFNKDGKVDFFKQFQAQSPKDMKH